MIDVSYTPVAVQVLIVALVWLLGAAWWSSSRPPRV